MTKNELSLLLFLETRAVDHGGLVDQKHMNDDDRAILEMWTKDGFVESGRVCYADVKISRTHQCTTWVKLSDNAFEAAHAERRARADRMWKNRSYLTTKEKQTA